jgi:beta-galactosidase
MSEIGINKVILTFLLVFQIGSLAAQGFGKSTPISAWKFHLGDVKFGENELFDDSKWENVLVPHDWSVKQMASPHYASCMGYLPGGIGWYRTKITLPAGISDKHYFVYFEGVYNNSEVYFNGRWLGKHYDGYTSFMYDVTPYIKPGQENFLAVRVDHSKDADSRWYTGSGIYRPVSLVESGNTHIDLWGVFYRSEEVNQKTAIIRVSTTIKNEKTPSGSIDIIQELLDKEGKVVSTAKSKVNKAESKSITQDQSLTVRDPILWDIDHPYLYRLKTTLAVNGKTIDESIVPAGIRYLSFDPDKGFALNHKWMKVKGVCLHHDAGVLGSAVPAVVWKERIIQLKAIGCNAIRMSHNPQAQALYDMCDEMGMLVIDEAFDEWEYQKKKWIVGWNVGEPGFQGAAEYFREHGKETLASMVLRDRNHPSVFMWSIGNEVDYPNDPYTHPVLDKEGIGQYHISGYQPTQPSAQRLGDIANELAAVVRSIDTSRPVTAALAGAVMSNETAYPQALDVVGYNYTEYRYKTDHEKYPKRVLYGSENRHDLPAWKSVAENDFIFGQFIWTGADYLGESGTWPSRASSSGLLDLTHQIKPIGYFRQSLWSDKPMVYISTAKAGGKRFYNWFNGTKSWNYETGDTVRVICFTNCDEAELTLNDKVIGKRQKHNTDTGFNYWDIPFEPGVLKAVAYTGNAKISEDLVLTTGYPVALKSAVLNGQAAQKEDVTMLTVTIVDASGNRVYLADNKVTCKISGPGRLLGMENASYYHSLNMDDHVLACKDGQLLVYIQATDDKGEITAEFESPLLEKTRQVIRVGK